LKAGALADEATRDLVLARLSRHGIDTARCQLRDPTHYGAYLDDYSLVDIALDPFPFNGGMTTLDGLWQGVPVLTMSGRSHVSRVGGSIMSALGLTEWIAGSPDEFGALARQRAADIPQLARLRMELRDRLHGSAVGDVRRFAHDMSQAWRQLWHEWCRSHEPGAVGSG
jgi:predicted O-linked N-acetylglucosamine transferase (SPINDLY family)